MTDLLLRLLGDGGSEWIDMDGVVASGWPRATACPGITNTCRIDPAKEAVTATRASGGSVTVAGMVPSGIPLAARTTAVLTPIRSS